MRTRTLIAVLALAAPSAARAQTSPFLPEPLYRHLVNEISGDRAFESVRHLSHYHRTDGSRDFFAATEWISRRGRGRGARGRPPDPPEVGRPRLVVPLAARPGSSRRRR